MANLFFNKRRGKWYGRVKGPDGKWTFPPLFRDKQASQALANKLQRDAERERAGLPVAQERNLHQPLGVLIDERLAELLRHGTPADSQHYKDTKRMLQRIVKWCGWTTLAS